MSRLNDEIRRSTEGFTFFEVILVLALLIAVMALAVPVIQTMFDDTRLRAATDMVRARLADTRSQAIKEGAAYQFKVKPNTGEFRIESAETKLEAADSKSGFPKTGKLPNQVVFIAQQNQATESDSVGYQTVVTYLPDGTGMYDSTFAFGKSGIHVVVAFRAMTGAISVTETVNGANNNVGN